MMNATIKSHNPEGEFYTDEKCYITELSNNTDDEAVSIARARIEPGITTRWHRLHNIVERYNILSGTGLIEAANLEPRKVHAGDTIIIPSLCQQRISNIGDEDLIFLAICSPRFTRQAYEDIENKINR